MQDVCQFLYNEIVEQNNCLIRNNIYADFIDKVGIYALIWIKAYPFREKGFT